MSTATVAAPPAQFNIAAHLLGRNAAHGARPAFVDDRGTLSYGAARRPGAALRRRPAGARTAARRARPAGDARQQPLAGRVPRCVVCGCGAGGGQHAADARRLRLHARALRAHRRCWCPRRCCRRCRRRWRKAPTRSATCLISGDAPADALAVTPLARPFAALLEAAPLAAAGGDARPRHRLLAVLVRLDRSAQGHRAHARQPVLDGRALWPRSARTARERRVLLRGEAVLRLRPRQCADVSDERRRHGAADGRAPDARRGVPALARRGPGRQADRVLRCADRLCRHAGVPEPAAA